MVDEVGSEEAKELVTDFQKSVTDAIPGVNGVAIGMKEVESAVTGDVAIKVYVSRKRPESYLPSSEVLPKTYEFDGTTYKVDVVEAGPFYPLALLSPADQLRYVSEIDAVMFDQDFFTDRYRPVPFGVSIGHYEITAGTLGCLVTEVSTGKRLILSNNHVFAAVNSAEIGDPIIQPGAADLGSHPADTVANLYKFAPILFDGQANYVDAAVALPTPGVQFVTDSAQNGVGPIGADTEAVGILFAGDCGGNIFACKADRVASALGVSFDGGHGSAALLDQVQKVGRTTGWTSSRVLDVSVEIQVNMGSGGIANFVDLMRIPAMGHPGDSGSIIFRRRGVQP